MYSLNAPAGARESSFGPADAKSTYYWISNKANLPLFVQYDYVGMKAHRRGTRRQGHRRRPDRLRRAAASSPPSTRCCAQKPSGVSVVGGWDPSLTESVKKCMEQGVPTVVDDGDLPDSGRLAYIGTNWTQVGVAQAKKMMEMLPNGGKLAMMSIINAGNMREARRRLPRPTSRRMAAANTQIVANEDDGGDAQEGGRR